MKTYKPRTPTLRATTVVSFRSVLSAGVSPYKLLTKGHKKNVGRNNAGRITVRHKGGGHKRLYREIDFSYAKQDVSARVETVEYDPNRSAFIALVCYRDGERRYIILPKSLSVGDEIIASKNAPAKPGNRLPLREVPTGTFVYNVEIQPNGGGKLGRSAGTHIEVAAKDAPYVQLRMSSGEVRNVPEMCWATIGEVSNSEHKLRNFGKAGRSRWKGIRPTVRGTAMNPVDHPHGGGEGVQGRGLRRAKTMWGKPSGKGQKTRTPKKYSNPFIVSRRKKKRG